MYVNVFTAMSYINEFSDQTPCNELTSITHKRITEAKHNLETETIITHVDRKTHIKI